MTRTATSRPTTIALLRARQLRYDSTRAEGRLWRQIRDRSLGGVKFRRQVPVGPFIVDFLAPNRRLIVELDGGQHAEEETRQKHQERTLELERRGFRVLRFWNGEVLQNTAGVLEAIQRALSEGPLPRPDGRGRWRRPLRRPDRE